MIETDLKNKIKTIAQSQSLTLAEYCRNKIVDDSKLLKIEKMIKTILRKKHKFDLNEVAFERLKECKSKNNIINFKTIWEKLCRNFSIKKEDCWKLLKKFEEEGKIKFVKCKGVKIVD